MLKDKKFEVSARNTTTQDLVSDKKIVVTIPDDLPLTAAEKSILSKGLTFVPVNNKVDEYQVKANCEKFYRRLRLETHFHDQANNETSSELRDQPDPFAKFDAKISLWTPPEGQFSAVDHYFDRCPRFVNSLNFNQIRTRRYTNLSHSEREALCTLRQCTDVVVKPADKGGAVVVWSRPLYLQEAHRQLSDLKFYERISADSLQEYQKQVKTTINDMISTCALPPSAKRLIVDTPRSLRLYLLPKIHKPNNPGRPIVSACSCPTENVSAFLDGVLASFVKTPTYVRDTNHTLHIFDSFRFDTADPGDRFLFTMDVKSLYTVIPNDCGLQA